MLIESQRDLNVYKKAFRVSVGIHELTKTFPDDEKYSLSSQMRRASRSICANLAEGFAKQKTSKSEFKRFVMMSIGSSAEMTVWLEFAYEFKYITDDNFHLFIAEFQEISAMLRSFHSKIS